MICVSRNEYVGTLSLYLKIIPNNDTYHALMQLCRECTGSIGVTIGLVIM